jgi:hypothetical protein
MNIWKNNPSMITHEQALYSEDADINEFAKSLDENYLFIDLRNAQIGDGFSWGRYGPKTVNKRFGQKTHLRIWNSQILLAKPFYKVNSVHKCELSYSS